MMLVVKAGIAAADGFQPVVEIEHHLVQRQLIDHHGAVASIGKVVLPAAPVLAKLEHGAEIFVGHQDGRLDPGLFDALDLHHIGHVGRVVQLDHLPVRHVDVVDHARRGGDKVDIEFAFEAFADDFEVKQAEEAAAEAEAQRGAGFHLVLEAGVVEAQPRHGLAQVLELRGVHREEAAEHHRLHRLEAGERLRGLPLFLRHRIAHAGVRHFLDCGGEEADLAGPQHIQHFLLGPENADAIHEMRAPVDMSLMRAPFLRRPSTTRTSTTTPR